MSGRATPEPGDASLCIRCGEFAAQRPTAEQLQQWQGDRDRWARMLAAQYLIRRQYRSSAN